EMRLLLANKQDFQKAYKALVTDLATKAGAKHQELAKAAADGAKFTKEAATAAKTIEDLVDTAGNGNGGLSAITKALTVCQKHVQLIKDNAGKIDQLVNDASTGLNAMGAFDGQHVLKDSDRVNQIEKIDDAQDFRNQLLQCQNSVRL